MPRVTPPRWRPKEAWVDPQLILEEATSVQFCQEAICVDLDSFSVPHRHFGAAATSKLGLSVRRRRIAITTSAWQPRPRRSEVELAPDASNEEGAAVERRLLVAPSEQTGTPSWDSKLPRCKTPRRRKPRILLLRNTRFVCDLSLENIVISLMIVFVIHFFLSEEANGAS